MKRNYLRLAGAATVVTALAFAGTAAIGAGNAGKDRSAELSAKIDPKKPRNVIVIIGDGMDDSIITAARNYELGADGRFALDKLPFTGAMTTYGLKFADGPKYPKAYVSDSAPTASGWSTGKKTVDGRISQGPSSAAEVPGEDYATAMQNYKKAGKRTGNVSTAELTDATPAAATTSINARACQGPEDMADCKEAQKSEGGKGSIAEQLVDNKVDVLLGGGAARFAQKTDDGPSVLDYAKDQRNYSVVDSRSTLRGVESVEDGPILGLFTDGNMKPRYEPLVATAAGAGGGDARCRVADRGNQPALGEMTKKAIDLLDNKKGFFLQVESAMVDKAEHGSDVCGAIGDVRELDTAVEAALAYQKSNPDTQIIVTGDHAHSTQIVGDKSGGKQTATLKTADGDPMSLAYSTQNVGSSHTGTQVRVAASGPQAANVTGVIDQTDLFTTMMGRKPSKPGNPPAQPGKPAATIQVPGEVTLKDARQKGIRVTTAVANASQARIEIRQGDARLIARDLRADGGNITLKVPNARAGVATVTVTAKGDGGESTASKKFRIVR